MALRVLLADESGTIKRVIQLALQDYAVDVKAVPVGLDVMSVTKSFNPDVIFADILLPKRNGYDICQDLKTNPQTQKIPVILMWSGFMDLDEKKASQSRADGRLEKPFETEQLRSLVQSLVPKLKNNPVSSYLKFPKLPEFSEEPSATDDQAPFDIDALPEVSEEDFQQVPLHHPIAENPKEAPEPQSFKIELSQEDDNVWAKQDINQFKLDLPVDDEPDNGFNKPMGSFSRESRREIRTAESQFSNPSIDHKMNLNPSGSFEEIVFETPKPNTSPNTQQPSALDIALMEKVIREEAQKMLESMIWKILPNIAERVVKDEINKLLQETEKSI